MVESSLNFIGTSGFASPNENAAIDVVFVHGLGGNSFNTWSSSDDPSDFWPKWLAEDFTQINVWTAGYDSAVFAGSLAGEGSSIADCSTILRDFLLSKGLGARQTVFITHSMGGLIVKQMLRRCSDSLDARCKALLANTGGVIFIGTPHQGSGLASVICTLLNVIASKHVKQLALSDEHLLDLNNWFRNWTVSNQVLVAAYYEIDKTSGVHVVNQATADPNVLGCEIVGIKGNHIQICKPATHEAQLYTSISALLRRLTTGVAPAVSATTFVGTTLVALPIVDARALLALTGSTSITKATPDLSDQMLAHISLPSVLQGEIASPTSVAECPSLPPELLVDYQYFTTLAPSDRRPLAEKLEAGGRSREVKDAQRKKERFAMSLRKHSAQASSLARYIRLLSDVGSRFERQVQASINSGASESEINRLVQEAVIDPAMKSHLMETNDATASLVESALYYLTGNCHVRWDADKD